MNVWLALILENHVHRASALQWWNGPDAKTVAFSRLTQISVLRLLTTSAAMDGTPLTSAAAWQTYDRLFAEERVAFLPEPSGLETAFRKFSHSETASPKVWADAYLAAFALSQQGQLVTFDRALTKHGAACLLLS